jgi:hypothetical protein
MIVREDRTIVRADTVMNSLNELFICLVAEIAREFKVHSHNLAQK